MTAGGDREDLRAVLHHQGGRQGHRPRPLDGLRHRQAVRRLHRRAIRRPGEGTTFRDLPAAPRPGGRGGVEEPKPEAARSRPPTSPARARSCWSRTRSRCGPSTPGRSSARGYTVLEAASGVEALEIIEERGAPVDLVVSDVVMPEMDGPTLLGELRKRYPDLKVDLRLRLCRGRLQEEPARRRGVQFPAQALQPAAARRDGEAGDRRLERRGSNDLRPRHRIRGDIPSSPCEASARTKIELANENKQGTMVPHDAR